VTHSGDVHKRELLRGEPKCGNDDGVEAVQAAVGDVEADANEEVDPRSEVEQRLFDLMPLGLQNPVISLRPLGSEEYPHLVVDHAGLVLGQTLDSDVLLAVGLGKSAIL
jgi:hypothetical protein